MSSGENLLTTELLLTLKYISGYSYSKEKNKILYSISQGDLKENKYNRELYIINPDGTDVKLCSSPREQIVGPTFILKGEKIAYILKGELYAMNIDGSNKKKILCEKNGINSNISGFLFSENMEKLILVKSVKLDNLQVKTGNDVYKDLR